jgi:hypothetical protein
MPGASFQVHQFVPGSTWFVEMDILGSTYVVPMVAMCRALHFSSPEGCSEISPGGDGRKEEPGPNV